MIQSTYYGGTGYSKDAAKLGHATRITGNGKNASVSPVSGLLNKVCPSHIQRPAAIHALRTAPAFVASELVWPSVDFESVRAFSKHAYEVRKPSQSIADNDAYSAIIRPPWVSWISASLNHVAPRFVCSGTSGVSVCGYGLDKFSVTAFHTGATRASCKVGVRDNGNEAAVALAQTSGAFMERGSVLKHFPVAKCSSDKGYSGRHNVCSISNVVFSGGRPAITGARCDSIQYA